MHLGAYRARRVLLALHYRDGHRFDAVRVGVSGYHDVRSLHPRAARVEGHRLRIGHAEAAALNDAQTCGQRALGGCLHRELEGAASQHRPLVSVCRGVERRPIVGGHVVFARVAVHDAYRHGSPSRARAARRCNPAGCSVSHPPWSPRRASRPCPRPRRTSSR